jgi:hypothetical protein
MTGRRQTLPWWLGGGKDDRKPNTLAPFCYIFFYLVWIREGLGSPPPLCTVKLLSETGLLMPTTSSLLLGFMAKGGNSNYIYCSSRLQSCPRK